MAIGQLKFELPEERDSFEIAVHSGEAFSRLWDFANYLRDLDKYQSDNFSEETRNRVQEIRRRFHEELQDVPHFNEMP